jgi:AcrR family transcriptional regulator
MVAAAESTGSDSKERILNAALDAFAENGFDGATTRDIAARADVNLGLIQYYFDGKLKLWRAAVDRAFADLRGALADDVSDDTLLASDAHTRLMLRRYVRFVAQRPGLVRLMHDEGKRRGPRMRWLVDRHVRPLYERVREMMSSAQQRGLLPAHIDPLHFHYVLIGAVGTIFHQAEECRRLTGVDPMAPEAVEAHADAVAYLLLGPEENA